MSSSSWKESSLDMPAALGRALWWVHASAGAELMEYVADALPTTFLPSGLQPPSTANPHYKKIKWIIQANEIVTRMWAARAGHSEPI